MLTWLITRPLEEAVSLADDLVAHGLAARALPCIERVEQPWPEWPVAPGPERRERVLLVTSGAVVAGVAERLEELGDISVAAIAPTTAARLRAAGVPVEIEADGGVRELARAVERWALDHGRPLDVFYPTSDAAERQPEHREALSALSRLGAVKVAEVYSVRPLPSFEAQLAQQPAPVGVFLASPSAVEAFVPAAQRSPPAAVVLAGHSTLRAWTELAPRHWPTPVLHPKSAQLVATLRAAKETPS